MPTDPASLIPDFLYGTAWKEDRTPALVELALRMGFRAIDTANQRRHYFEEGVGQGLAAAYRAGLVTRDDLFLQTKFTYQRGQDHRLPYDPAATLSAQVAQSMASSLDHLGTDHVDSYVLHGPASNYDWTGADAEVWEAMRKERDAGRTRLLGVSNVSLRPPAADGGHARRTSRVRPKPLLCPPRLGPRRAAVLSRARHHLSGVFAAHRESGGAAPSSASPVSPQAPNATLAQVVFSFAAPIGILPLTGTSDAEPHEAGFSQPRAEYSRRKRCKPSSRWPANVSGTTGCSPAKTGIDASLLRRRVTSPARPLRARPPAAATSRNTAPSARATPSAVQIRRCVHAPARRSGRRASPSTADAQSES